MSVTGLRDIFFIWIHSTPTPIILASTGTVVGLCWSLSPLSVNGRRLLFVDYGYVVRVRVRVKFVGDHIMELNGLWKVRVDLREDVRALL